jgi:hypothetical protein
MIHIFSILHFYKTSRNALYKELLTIEVEQPKFS